MIPGFQLHAKRLIAIQHARQNFLSGLDQSLCPARLLRLKCGHLHRKLGGALNVLKINKFPSLELSAVGKVGIFGQRVMLPAPGSFDRSPPPHAGCPVEIKKYVTARPTGVFEHKVTIEQDGLNLG